MMLSTTPRGKWHKPRFFWALVQIRRLYDGGAVFHPALGLVLTGPLKDTPSICKVREPPSREIGIFHVYCGMQRALAQKP